MCRLRAPHLLAILALGTWPVSRAAHADEPTGADKAMAETLFRAARTLMDQGKVAEACERFSESQKLEPKLGTLLNLAVCHEQLGRTASAWGEFADAAGQAKLKGQPDREEFARQRAAALEPKLARVVLTGSTAGGVSFIIDGQPLGASALGAPLPMDPGEHVISVEAPGKKRWEARITVPRGPAMLPVEIPDLEEATPPPPPPRLTPLPPPLPPPPLPPKGPSGARIAGIVIGSVGLAGLALGGLFGGLAFAREAEAKRACPNTACPTQEGLDLHTTAGRFATGSTVAFIAGGVAAAGGVVLLLVSRDKAPPRRSAWLAPAPGGLAIGGQL
jgi:hypothetical protein